MGWIDQALSVGGAQRAAERDRVTCHDRLPDLAGCGSAPAAHSLPTGALIGRMEIPHIGISVMVLEGDGEGVLAKAVGHVPITAFPGGMGNVVIAGHRDTFFRALRNIQKGDEITFTTVQGIYHYQVGSIDKVGPQDVQVLQASGRRTLTLITCFPFYYVGSAPQRFIVRAWETHSPQMDQPDQIRAKVSPAMESASRVRSTFSAGRKVTRLSSSESPTDSPRNRTSPPSLEERVQVSDGSGPMRSSAESPLNRILPPLHSEQKPARDGPESTQESAEAKQVDPPKESPPSTPHRILRNVRRWLGRLHPNRN